MLFTAAAILVLFVIFTGVGLVFPRSLYRKEPSFDHLVLAFWVGWALSLAFLQVWQLAFRVAGWVMLLVVAVSIAGWFAHRKTLLDHLRTWKPGSALPLAALGLIPCLVVADHVLFAKAHSDHGLYHLQTVSWFTHYPIVPGLGNLHFRLAFNNANFLYGALINQGILEARGYYVSNTLLAFVLILTCAAGFYQVFRPVGTVKKVHVFYGLMIPAVLWHLSTTHLPGFSPDVPVFTLQVILAGMLLELYETARDRDGFHRRAMLIVLLAAAGITVKKSFIAFSFLILLAVLLLWVARFRGSIKNSARALLAWAAVGAALVVPWLVREVILSGYLLYPSTLIAFPLPWTIPLDLAYPVQEAITIWAQTASNQIAYTGDLSWLANWWRFFPFEVRQAFLLTLAIIGMDVILFLLLRRKACADGGAAVLFAVSAASLIYWFVLAPDYRFSGALFWMLLVCAILFGFNLLISAQWVRSPLLLFSAVLLGLTLWISPNQFSRNISRAWFFVPPPQTSVPTYQTRVTSSGLAVNMPVEGESCAGIPLPCTPPADFLTGLRLIDPNDMQKGFMVKLTP